MPVALWGCHPRLPGCMAAMDYIARCTRSDSLTSQWVICLQRALAHWSHQVLGPVASELHACLCVMPFSDNRADAASAEWAKAALAGVHSASRSQTRSTWVPSLKFLTSGSIAVRAVRDAHGLAGAPGSAAAQGGGHQHGRRRPGQRGGAPGQRGRRRERPLHRQRGQPPAASPQVRTSAMLTCGLFWQSVPPATAGCVSTELAVGWLHNAGAC